MTRTISKVVLSLFIIMMIVFVTPLSVQADGDPDGFVQTINGYQVSLIFAEDPTVGENQIHVQIHDSMDMPVSHADVQVSVASPAEEHAADGHGVVEEPSGHENMPGMDHTGPAVEQGSTHEEMQAFALEPSHHEEGEYSGAMHIESSGDWTITVHLTVEGESMEVEFPVMIKSGVRNTILTTFAGINLFILIVAAALKSKSASK